MPVAKADRSKNGSTRRAETEWRRLRLAAVRRTARVAVNQNFSMSDWIPVVAPKLARGKIARPSIEGISNFKDAHVR